MHAAGARSRADGGLATLFLIGVLLVLSGTLSLLRWADQRASATPVTDIGPAGFSLGRPSGAPGGVVVVRITADSCDGRDVGTGFVVDDGRVLTARHVVEGASTARVDAGGRSYDAKVVAVDARRDVALLEVPRLAGHAELGPEPARNDVVSVAGHPAGGPLTVARGAVSSWVDRGPLALDGHRVMVISAPVEPGESGGPVLDGQDRVVGVAIGVERSSGTGLVVPVGELRDLLAGRGTSPPACPAGARR